MKPFKFAAVCGITLILSSIAAWAETAATARKNTTIYSAPDKNSEGVAKIKKGAELSLGERQGLWYVVETPHSGYVKMTDVAVATEGKSIGLAGLASGRSGAGNSVAATGVRGLDAEAVVTGDPDFEAASQMNDLSADDESMDEFFSDAEEREVPARKSK